MQSSTSVAFFFPYAFVFTFLIFFCGLFAWWAKARFYYADETFLKIDKYLKKYGMWALLNISYVYFMASIITYGCIVLFFYLRNWF
jgi:hypothetical protein